MRSPIFAVLSLAALAACTRADTASRAPAPPRPAYLAGVPRIPASLLSDTTGTATVQHQVLVLQAPYDSVLAFYRRELPARGWAVMSDVADTALASLYLQRDSVALWVQIHRMGPRATEYALTAGPAGTQPSAAASPGR